MKNLADYTLTEIKEILNSVPAYRAGQLFKWVSLGASYSEMTNIPAALRDTLQAEYCDNAAEIVKEIKASDGSVKLLYRLNDGNVIEGIYMPHSYGDTLCVSTQVGCRMGCVFCASHIGGLKRNLTAGEIYGQVIAANKRFKFREIEDKNKAENKNNGVENQKNEKENAKTANENKKVDENRKDENKKDRIIDKIVLMGSGEPLDNYDNTLKFIELVTAVEGLNLSQRSISLSTCGLPDMMKKLADDGLSVNLSLSLHATTDETRNSLMPISKKHTIKEIIDATRYYFDKTGRRVSIEYALIKDINMSFFDVKRLKELTANMSCHINLIMLNRVKESTLSPCTKPEADRFLKRLLDAGLSATIRKSAGSDVAGACGQLRSKYVSENKHKI